MKKLTTEEFISKAVKIHNNKYNYSKVTYVNNRTKITITCSIHGDFKQTPNNHLNGKGCPVCSGNVKLTTSEFISKANKIHNDKYNYSKVRYVNNKTKIIVTCHKHGDFKQTPNNHLRGMGCPVCSGNVKLTTSEFISKANKTHNNKYYYSKTKYINNATKVIITCSEHGDFKQTPNAHLNGKGCPVCKASHAEREIIKILEKKNIKYVHQKIFDTCINPKTGFNLPYDIYIPAYNAIIEYHGKQHYEKVPYFSETLEYRQYKDSIKKDWAISNGFNFIEIPYTTDNLETEVLKII